MPTYNVLSKELIERIEEDRRANKVNPCAFKDEDVVRRDLNHDRANIWRPAFVRDCEKIMNIPLYSRYADKTQVFSLYKNDDISRRSLHVQFVSRIARNIGRMLGLNIDLIEAIALGHDLGHTPFGHAGERMLNELYYGNTCRYFNHNVHSVRALDKVYHLNISLQTLDGILCHNGELEQQEYRPKPYKNFAILDDKMEKAYTELKYDRKLVPATLEACVMRVSDIIAYLGKDRQDAEKLGIFENKPEYANSKIGTQNAEIINNMIVNIVENSYGKDYLKMDEEYFEAFSKGKKENYKLIYGNEKVEKAYTESIKPMMEAVYKKLLKDIKEHNEKSVIYEHHINVIENYTNYYSKERYIENSPDDIVVDYIASMTDDYFVDLYRHLFPTGNLEVKYIGYFGK